MGLPDNAAAATGRVHGRNAFFFIIITVFIDIMAFAVVIPVVPKLIAELVNGKEALAAVVAAAENGDKTQLETMLAAAAPWGGFMSAVYAVLNFFMQPVLGNLSDRFGRRPILLASMGMLAVDFLIMGFAHSIWLLFLGRMLSGISGATHSTASAYIADVTEPQRRGAAFGMLGAAFGVGFILGPVIGGLLGSIDPRAPFFASAALCGINFLYGSFVLPESLKPENRRRFDWARANALGAFKHFAHLPQLSWFIVAYGLYMFAHWVYPATFSYFGQIRYGWNEATTGLALGVVGIGSAVVSAVLVGPTIKHLGATRTAFAGFVVTIIAMIGYALADKGWMIFAIIPFGALGGVLGPSMNQIMTARVPANAQGELQGALASAQAFGNLFSPLIMTQTLSYFSAPAAPIYLPGAAFLLAAGVATLGMIPLVAGLRSTRKVEPAAATESSSAPAASAEPQPAAAPAS